MYDSFNIETEERREIADNTVDVFGGETKECVEVVENNIGSSTTKDEYSYIIYHPPKELADTPFDYYITPFGHITQGNTYRETVEYSFEKTNRADASTICGATKNNPQHGTRLQQHYLSYISEQKFDTDAVFWPEQERLDDLSNKRAHRRIPFTIPSVIQASLCKRCYRSYQSTWNIRETIEIAKNVVHTLREHTSNNTSNDNKPPTVTEVKEDARELLVKLNKVKRNKPSEQETIEINKIQRKLEEFTNVRAVEIDDIYDVDEYHPATDNEN